MLPAQIRQAEKKAAALKQGEASTANKAKKLLVAAAKRNKNKTVSSIPALIRQQTKKTEIAQDAAEKIAAEKALITADYLKNGESIGKSPANYETALIQLSIHQKQLKGKTLEQKTSLKIQFIQEYLPFLDAYRAAGVPSPNEVLARVLVWMADCEMFAECIDWADFAVEINLDAPEGFKSDLPTTITRTLLTWCEAQYKSGQSSAPYFQQLLERVESRKWPISQIIVEGNVYKLAGRLADDASDFKTAVAYYTRCMEVNPKTDSSGGGGAVSLLNAAAAKDKSLND